MPWKLLDCSDAELGRFDSDDEAKESTPGVEWRKAESHFGWHGWFSGDEPYSPPRYVITLAVD